MVLDQCKISRNMRLHEGKWLKSQIASIGVSQSAFARRIGMKVQSVTRWFRQERLMIRSENLYRIAAGLGITFEQLNDRLMKAHQLALLRDPSTREKWDKQAVEAEGWKDKPASEWMGGELPHGGTGEVDSLAKRAGIDAEMDANVEPYTEERFYKVPEYEVAVAAGEWVETTEEEGGSAPWRIDHGVFRIRIRGDSMKPEYKDGQIIEFQCLRFDVHSPVVGCDYYVQQSDGRATFKRMEKIDEDYYTLRAINRKKYSKPMVVSKDMVSRMALALGQYIPKNYAKKA